MLEMRFHIRLLPYAIIQDLTPYGTIFHVCRCSQTNVDRYYWIAEKPHLLWFPQMHVHSEKDFYQPLWLTEACQLQCYEN